MKRICWSIGVFALTISHMVWAEFITIASTTSTENSGLFDVLNPAFTQASGIDVKVVAVGTGKAIKIAQSGDADVLFVHHRKSEDEFVAQGYGDQRYDVMYNDFILVGPQEDPANVQQAQNVVAALNYIAQAQSRFLSRGDDSGTHKKELSLWELSEQVIDKGRWYLETGQGMGKTLGMAVQLGAYTLTDRATWLNYANTGNLTIVFENDPPMFNPYGIIGVSVKKYPHVKHQAAQQYIDFVISAAGQQIIGDYKINGEQAFFPNATPRKNIAAQ